MTNKLPPLLLEKLALDEVSAGDRAKLEATYGAQVINEQVSRLELENQDILDAHPVGVVSQEIRRQISTDRANVSPKTSSGFWVGGAAMAVAAAVALFFFTQPKQIDDHIILKGGGPRLAVYRKGPQGAERLPANSLVNSGDLLQVRYVAGGAKFGAIYSIDGRGAVTRHDKQGETISHLKEGGEIDLGHSYELDRAPDFEIFMFLTGDHPVPASVLKDSIKAAKFSSQVLPTLDLPDNWRVHYYVLLKGAVQ